MSPDHLRVDRTASSLASLSDESDEKAYWLSKTPHERLQALATMRQILYTIRRPCDFKEYLKLLSVRQPEHNGRRDFGYPESRP